MKKSAENYVKKIKEGLDIIRAEVCTFKHVHTILNVDQATPSGPLVMFLYIFCAAAENLCQCCGDSGCH